MKLTRYSKNPILSPNPQNHWESLVTTNPAAWYEPEEGKVYMLYRAAGDDPEHVVRLGLAESYDGFNFKRISDTPAMEPIPGSIDSGAIEDPRIVKIDGWYYVTYASRPFCNGQYWQSSEHNYKGSFPRELPAPFNKNLISSCLAFTKDFLNWSRAGLMTSPEIHDHDVILFPEKIDNKFAILHRPDFSDGKNLGIWISFTSNPLKVKNSELLAMPEQEWEGWKIGGNCPPIKTDAGWLLIYHGVSKDRFYRLGAMLLDSQKPSKVLHRSSTPIFEPEEWYELKGCHNYKGVVFPCGNIVKDGKLIVYYGGADKYVGAAYIDLDTFIKHLMEQ